MSELFPRAVLDKAKTDDDTLTHIFCHNENRAICGADITDAPLVPPMNYPDDCIVCVEMEYAQCPECGL